jgi:hypothetical protein
MQDHPTPTAEEPKDVKKEVPKEQPNRLPVDDEQIEQPCDLTQFI